jgi:hypothetical protein
VQRENLEPELCAGERENSGALPGREPLVEVTDRVWDQFMLGDASSATAG